MITITAVLAIHSASERILLWKVDILYGILWSELDDWCPLPLVVSLKIECIHAVLRFQAIAGNVPSLLRHWKMMCKLKYHSIKSFCYTRVSGIDCKAAILWWIGLVPLLPPPFIVLTLPIWNAYGMKIVDHTPYFFHHFRWLQLPIRKGCDPTMVTLWIPYEHVTRL